MYCQAAMEKRGSAIDSRTWIALAEGLTGSSPPRHSSCTESWGSSMGGWGRQAGEGPHHPHQHSLPTLWFTGVTWGAAISVTWVQACLSLLPVEFGRLRFYDIHTKSLHASRDGNIGPQLLQRPSIHLVTWWKYQKHILQLQENLKAFWDMKYILCWKFWISEFT